MPGPSVPNVVPSNSNTGRSASFRRVEFFRIGDRADVAAKPAQLLGLLPRPTPRFWLSKNDAAQQALFHLLVEPGRRDAGDPALAARIAQQRGRIGGERSR